MIAEKKTALVANRHVGSHGGVYGLPFDSVVSQITLEAHYAAFAGLVAVAALATALLLRRYVWTPERSTSHDEDPQRSLSDEERVKALLRQRDGRMHQSEIVESVEWSKAKVSRLLTDLEESGTITKLRLGRENLICLRGREPQATMAGEEDSPSEPAQCSSP